MSSPDIPETPPPPLLPSEDPKVKKQRLEAERNQTMAKGRSSTMLTGGMGVDSSGTSFSSRMLLGS